MAKDASSIRIRDNQRRSRARRKEYIHDLEQRLWRFEQLGVEASQEIQAAGRKVAEENTLLRSLLRLRGVTDAEIEEYLGLARDDSGSGGRGPLVTRMSLSPDARLQQAQSTRSNEIEGRNDNLRASEVVASSSQPPPDCMRSVSDLNPGNNEAQSEACHIHGGLDQSLATSCEAAAKIIASMQGYPDTQDARAELGCSSTSDCMVKNTAIFEVLDRW
jgi:hypothetical protein